MSFIQDLVFALLVAVSAFTIPVAYVLATVYSYGYFSTLFLPTVFLFVGLVGWTGIFQKSNSR